MEILGALLAGSFIGAVLGFVGAGGAMLSVPILIYIFGYTPHHATTAALAVVFLASLSGAVPKMRLKEVLYRDALVIWGIGLITNLGFSSISDSLPESFITTGFSVVLTVAGISMLRNPFTDTHKRIPVSVLILVSLVIGAMTGLFGIGGGFLAIPVLVLFFGTPQKVAAGTSLLIISLNSLTALIGHYQLWDQVEWRTPALMATSAIYIAQLASRKNSGASPLAVKKGFSVLLFSVALFTFAKTWWI
ncbi:COG0730 Predicted permeases [Candidatus Nanopelagicaceae bacterium]